MPIDHKTYRKFKDSIFGRLQKVENFMDRITQEEPPRPDGGEESKLPASPSSTISGPGPEMEFDKKDEQAESENDCISHVEANCCNAITNNLAYICESNRWILTALSRLFFIGNVLLFEYLYVSKSVGQMVTRNCSTTFIVVSIAGPIDYVTLGLYDSGDHTCRTRDVLLRQSTEE